MPIVSGERNARPGAAASGRGRGPGDRLRRGLRLLVRLPFAAGSTALWTAVWFAGLPLSATSPPRRRSLRRLVFRSWARSCLASAGVRVEVRGPRPSAPCFLVANHLSYVDILVLAAELDCTFVSMAEVARWPWIGPMARSLGTIFLERERKRAIPEANRAIERALAEGAAVVLFPEGRSTAGAAVEAFRPSLLEPAAVSPVSIACATLRYQSSEDDPPASSSVCWVETPFPRHLVRLLGNREVRATVVFGEGPSGPRDRKELARELRRRVALHFFPMEH